MTGTFVQPHACWRFCGLVLSVTCSQGQSRWYSCVERNPTGLEFHMWTKRASSSQRSRCLCLLSVGIKGMRHHAWLLMFFIPWVRRYRWWGRHQQQFIHTWTCPQTLFWLNENPKMVFYNQPPSLTTLTLSCLPPSLSPFLSVAVILIHHVH